jgi:CBS domain-containing protein
MGSLRSCDQLRREHELIGEVVGGLDALAQRRRRRSGAVTLPFAGAVDFFAGFVVRCHDVKEEEALLPALVARAAVDDGLVDAIRRDHAEGGRLLEALRTSASRSRMNGRTWTLLESYLTLLRRHLASEDGGLLPLAERVLSPEDDADVERRFLQIEERSVGRAGSDALVALGRAVAQAAVAAAADHPAAGGHLRARQIMRPKPATVAPDESLAHAAELMDSLRTREVPVVAGGALVGILTRTDLDPHRGHYEWTAVRTAMTPDPVSVAPETPVPAVARLLVGRGFNALPVTERGVLLGMIARSDVLRVLGGDERAR